MKFAAKINNLFIFLLVLCILIPAGMADVNKTVSKDIQDKSSDTHTSELLFNGTLDIPGTISITASSGNSYSVPGNTPAGILEELKTEGKILNYSLGDELMNSRGILILNGINGLLPDKDKGWFVKVNGERLEDMVLSESMGLNKVNLNEGDVILYILGNPTEDTSQSASHLTVTIGSIKASNSTENTGNTSSGNSDTGNTSEDNSGDNNTVIQNKTGNSTSGNVIYSGSFELPAGDVNLTTTGGDYEIMAATPLGILQALLKDEKITALEVSDRSMKKGGILMLQGINDLQYSGDKTWFVKVNGEILKDYQDPSKDGLNTYKIKAGDEVAYYFGEPSKPVDEAQASIIITVK